MRTAVLVLLVGMLCAVANAQPPNDGNQVAIGGSRDEAPLPDGAIMRLGETRFRPGVRITKLVFSPDGKQLASLGNWLYFESRLSVWDVATGKELHTYPLDERAFSKLYWGADGRGNALLPQSQGPDRLSFWSFGDASQKPPGRKPVVSKEEFKKEVKLDKEAVDGGKKPAQIKKVEPPAQEAYRRFELSPDGTRLAVIGSGGTERSYVDVFEMRDAPPRKKSKRLAAPDDLRFDNAAVHFLRNNHEVAVFVPGDNKSEQQLVVFDIAKGAASSPTTVPMTVTQGQPLDFADDGSALAIGQKDGTIHVIGLPSGKERISPIKHHDPKRTGWSQVGAVKFVNGGRNILSAGWDNHQLVWNAQTGANVAVLDGHKSWVEAVAVSPDGKLVATAGQDSLIRLWNAETWQPVLAPQGAYATVWRLEVSRDGKRAAAGSGDGVHVWDLVSGQEIRQIPGGNLSTNVLFTPEGDVLTGQSDEGLSLHPLPTGLAKKLAMKGRLLDFTPDGKQLLTANGNDVLIWDWPAGVKKSEISLKGNVTSAAITPDGKIALVRVENNKSSLIDIKSGKLAGEIDLKLHWFSRAAGFGLNGRVASGTGEKSRPARAESWDITTMGLVRHFEPPPQIKTDGPGSGLYILSFAVSADGRRAASCHNDGSVTVYETASGQILAHFQGHREGTIAVALTPDGGRVLSGGGDHQVLVWDVSTAKLAGKPAPLAGDERSKAWDQLGTQSAKEAQKTIAALILDPGGTAGFLGEKLKPVPPVDPALLDRIFRDLDDPQFSVRDKADRELNVLGVGALPGVRERGAKASSLEVKQRANQFLRRLESAHTHSEEIRFSRALEVLATLNTSSARRLVETLANGAPDACQIEMAQRTLASMRK